MRYLLPTQCLLCDFDCTGKRAICDDCFNILSSQKTRCIQCKSPIDINDSLLRCGSCLANPPPFDYTFALFDYAEPISTLITQLKFHGNLSVAYLFAQCWIAHHETYYTANTWPELIIPVPLHVARLKERGFNQALEIAKPIGHYFHIPVDTRTCIRIKNTQAQSSLSANKRVNNVKNAFALSYSLTAKHVAIIDDVMTTGNTITEISALLKKVGVERIDVWCCARA